MFYVITAITLDVRILDFFVVEMVRTMLREEGRRKIQYMIYTICANVNSSGKHYLLSLIFNGIILQGQSSWEQTARGGSKGRKTKCLVSPRCCTLLPRLVSEPIFFFFKIILWLSLFSFQEVQRHPLALPWTCFPGFPPSPFCIQIHSFHSGGWMDQQ